MAVLGAYAAITKLGQRSWSRFSCGPGAVCAGLGSAGHSVAPAGFNQHCAEMVDKWSAQRAQ